MAKRPGSFTFTYSKRNQDVLDIITNKKQEDENFIVTDYMCEAVRFYEKYKNNYMNSTITIDDVKRIVNDILKNNDYIAVNKNDVNDNIIETTIDLNIDNIKDSDLEED